ELPLSEAAITVARHSHMLCLADAELYKLINLEQPVTFPLSPTPQVKVKSPTLIGSGTQLIPRPLVSVVQKDKFLIVNGSDDQAIGILVNAKGNPIQGTLQWTSYPKTLCVEFPYVIALLCNNTIEVHNLLNQNLLQTMTFDASFEARGMTFSHGIKVSLDALVEKLKRSPWPEKIDDAELESQLKGEISRYSTAAARILIYGKDSVLAQVTTPLIVQVDQLLEKNLVEEAIQLAEQAKDTMSNDSDHVYAERLQSELNYSYQRSGLYLLEQALFDDAFSLLSKGEIDPRPIVQLFDGLASSSWREEFPPVLLFDGVRTLLDTLGSVKDIVERNLKDYASDNLAHVRQTFLTNASDALDKYLCMEREKRKHQWGQNDLLCKVIDTCLLKIYIIKNDNISIYQLLKAPNDCSVEDCSEALSKSKKHYALSVLYESKHMYEKMFEIWTKIYAGELDDPEFKDGLGRIKRCLLRDTIAEELPLSVMMHYAWWLTHQNPADGVEVFTKSPRKQDMDPDEILEKLERYSNECVRTFLEYLVLEQHSDRSEYHTRLACSYVKDVYKEVNNNTKEIKDLAENFKQSADSLKADGSKEGSDRLTKSTFIGYLGSLQQQSQLVKARLILIRTLQNSSLYSPEILLEVLIKAGPLDIEKVIVYGKMNKHKEALDILIHDLCDFVGAETYCVTNGQSIGMIPPIVINTQPTTQKILPRTSSLAAAVERPVPLIAIEDEYLSPENLKERSILFTMLFKSYLAIKDSELMMARTMHLLNTQGVYLDILEVLETIPEDWSLNMLQDFLVRSLRRSLDDYKESQIVSSEMIKTFKEIGPISIDSQTTCLRCHRGMISSDVVRESEHGQLLHIHCAKLLGLVDE
ncbi:transforming growth factor, beta receptor associated protein 1, partial [Rhizopus stolonifer]